MHIFIIGRKYFYLTAAKLQHHTVKFRRIKVFFVAFRIRNNRKVRQIFIFLIYCDFQAVVGRNIVSDNVLQIFIRKIKITVHNLLYGLTDAASATAHSKKTDS